MLAVLTATLAACSSDPCDGWSAACVSLRLDAAGGIGPLDELLVHLQAGAITMPAYSRHAAAGASFKMPVELALLFDHWTAAGEVLLQASGRAAGVDRGATPAATFTLSVGEHLRQHLTLYGLDSGLDLSFVAAPDGAAVVDGGKDASHDLSIVGNCGAGMAGVPTADGVTSYCVDATEVTIASYAAFLAAGQGDSFVPVSCTLPHDHLPACDKGLADAGAGDRPVVCVDWCSAYAYCKWAGKHLCGHVGGGTLATTGLYDASAGEWFNACSHGGTQNYPYGPVFDPSACNGYDYSPQNLQRPVGSIASCEGSYAGLFDLSGNVAEWIDACDGSMCYTAGGGYYSSMGDLSCGFARPRYPVDRPDDVGFRCCK